MPGNPWDAALHGGWLLTPASNSCVIEPRNIQASVWFARGSAHYRVQEQDSLCNNLIAIASWCIAGKADAQVDVHVDVHATHNRVSFTGPASEVETAWARLVRLASGDAEVEAATEASLQRVSLTHHCPQHWVADAAIRTGFTEWTVQALPVVEPQRGTAPSTSVVTELFGPGVARLCTFTGHDAPEEHNLVSLSSPATTHADDAATGSVLRGGSSTTSTSGNLQRAGLFAMKPTKVAFTALLPHSETGFAAAHVIRTQLNAHLAQQATGQAEFELTALGDTLGVTALTPAPVADAERAALLEHAFANPSEDLAAEAAAVHTGAAEAGHTGATAAAGERGAFSGPPFSPERAFSSRPFEPVVNADAVAKVVGMARKTVHLPFSSTTAPEGRDWVRSLEWRVGSLEWIVPPLHIDEFPTEYRGWDTDVLATIGEDTFAVARMEPGSTSEVESLHGLSIKLPGAVIEDESGPHTWFDAAMRPVVCSPEAFHGQLREDLDKVFARAPRLKGPAPDAVLAARAHAAQGRRRRKRALIGGAVGVVALSASCIVGLLTLV